MRGDLDGLGSFADMVWLDLVFILFVWIIGLAILDYIWYRFRDR